MENSTMSYVGFRIWGLGFTFLGFQGLWFRFRAQGLGCGASWGFWIRVLGEVWGQVRNITSCRSSYNCYIEVYTRLAPVKVHQSILPHIPSSPKLEKPKPHKSLKNPSNPHY